MSLNKMAEITGFRHYDVYKYNCSDITGFVNFDRLLYKDNCALILHTYPHKQNQVYTPKCNYALICSYTPSHIFIIPKQIHSYLHTNTLHINICRHILTQALTHTHTYAYACTTFFTDPHPRRTRKHQ